MRLNFDLLAKPSFQTTEDGTRLFYPCLLYTSDAADERSSVDLGGRRIIKKKKHTNTVGSRNIQTNTHIPQHHDITE